MYAESGGQKGDRGVVELASGEEVQICDVQKYGGVSLHMVGSND
jgi:alanyl-tRNA synthetase